MVDWGKRGQIRSIKKEYLTFLFDFLKAAAEDTEMAVKTDSTPKVAEEATKEEKPKTEAAAASPEKKTEAGNDQGKCSVEKIFEIAVR